MAPYIIFNSRHFLDEVEKVKKFWLHTKRNRLRIEANKTEKRILLFSIHKSSGLETAISLPAYVSDDCIINMGTVGAFYDAVEQLQRFNVEENGSLRIQLVKSLLRKKYFILKPLKSGCDLIGSFEPIPQGELKNA